MLNDWREITHEEAWQNMIDGRTLVRVAIIYVQGNCDDSTIVQGVYDCEELSVERVRAIMSYNGDTLCAKFYAC